MHKRLLEANYRFRSPKPGTLWQRLLAPVPRWLARHQYRVTRIDVQGGEHLKVARDASGPVMVTVNHPAHGDPFMVFEAMRRLEERCCYLAAWQVFVGWFGIKSFAFRRMGCFSVDREGTDMRSFRTAVDVLGGRYSLVIFPEGDVYHINDRITPLREGAAMIALTADKRRQRGGGAPLRIVPCAIKYFYVQDPTPTLGPVMARLERSIQWRPTPERPLWDRIYRFADAMMAVKEIEYLGTPGRGPLPERIATLTEHVLSEMEKRRTGRVAKDPLPVRVKNLRHHVLRDMWPAEDAAPSAVQAPLPDEVERDLDDLHLVTQLFSYPGDYVAEKPTIERITETIDKFEEDALGAVDAGARADRRAMVSFGPAIEAGAGEGKARQAAGDLTARIEQAIQAQLDGRQGTDVTQ